MPDQSLSACREICRRCHETCLETIYHCLSRGGPQAEPGHIRILADCMEMCETSAHFLLRGSELHHVTCRACAEICDRCAEACERTAGEDEVMRACARTCRECAQECREMSNREHEHGEGKGPREVRVPSSTEIAALAEQLYAEAGRPLGRDQEFWYQAEIRLRSPGEVRPSGLDA